MSVTEKQSELERLRYLRRLQLEEAYQQNKQFFKYHDDPVGFCRDILGEEPWSIQRDIMYSVRDNKYTAVKSCHDSGKSYTASRIVCWFLSTRPVGEAFAVTTAPTFKQVKNILWREIHRAHAKGGLPGALNLTEWKMGDEIVAFGHKPADYDVEAFQGIHAPSVLLVLDEACGIPDVLIDAGETILTSSECRELAIGNPDDPSSPFARMFEPNSGYNCITISAWDTPNFTGEPVQDIAKRSLLDPDWVEDKKTKWGEDSPLYISKVCGEFPKDASDAVIPLSWILRASRKKVKATEYDPKIVSVDVARFGEDQSVIGLRHGNKFRILETFMKQDTVECKNRAIRWWLETGATSIKVDDVGVGAGVVDMLKNEGKPVIPLNSGWSPTDDEKKKRFHNIRAEWYWGLRDLFEHDQIEIPDDAELIEQLANIKYKVTPAGKILIESKEDMKARGLNSPDKADTLMMAFASPESGPKKGRLLRARKMR